MERTKGRRLQFVMRCSKLAENRTKERIKNETSSRRGEDTSIRGRSEEVELYGESDEGRRKCRMKMNKERMK